MVLASRQTYVDQGNRTESPSNKPNFYGQLVFDKSSQGHLLGEGESLFKQIVLEQLVNHMQE